jgi:hypothetical protein
MFEDKIYFQTGYFNKGPLPKPSHNSQPMVTPLNRDVEGYLHVKTSWLERRSRISAPSLELGALGPREK